MNRSAIVALLLAVVVACDRPAPAPDVVASWRGGAATLAEAEAQIGRQGSWADRDAAVAAYRKAAEWIALERILVEGIDLDARRRELAIEIATAQRPLRLQALRRAAGDAVAVSAAEVEEAFAARRDTWQGPEMRNLWHLYLRVTPERDEAAVRAAMAEIEARLGRGESFARLAEELSDSETARVGGRLGWIGRPRLPPAVADPVFAAPLGSLVGPLQVGGGLALFWVEDRLDTPAPSLAEATRPLRRLLGEEREGRWLAERLATTTLPEKAVALDRGGFEAAAEQGADDAVMAQVGDQRLTFGEIRAALEADAKDSVWNRLAPPDAFTWYELAVLRLRALDAGLDGVGENPALARRLEAIADRTVREEVVSKQLDERLRALAAGKPKALAQFFEDRRHLYQSALGLHLRRYTVPLGPVIEAHVGELDGAARLIGAGVGRLDDLVERFGGRVQDLGWVEAAALGPWETKVRNYVLDVRAPGTTPLFQLDQALHVIEVVERHEPEPLPRAEVEPRLLSDFVAARHDELLAELSRELLAERRFRFEPDRVPTRAPAAPHGGPPAPPPA